MMEEAERCAKNGFDYYLAKPISALALRDSVFQYAQKAIPGPKLSVPSADSLRTNMDDVQAWSPVSE